MYHSHTPSTLTEFSRFHSSEQPAPIEEHDDVDDFDDFASLPDTVSPESHHSFSHEDDTILPESPHSLSHECVSNAARPLSEDPSSDIETHDDKPLSSASSPSMPDGSQVPQRRKRSRGNRRSLQELYPDIASEWSPDNATSPSEVNAHKSSPRYLWQCSQCHHTYARTIVSRTVK